MNNRNYYLDLGTASPFMNSTIKATKGVVQISIKSYMRDFYF